MTKGKVVDTTAFVRDINVRGHSHRARPRHDFVRKLREEDISQRVVPAVAFDTYALCATDQARRVADTATYVLVGASTSSEVLGHPFLTSCFGVFSVKL